MPSLTSSLSAAHLALANAAECVQPFSPQARQLDQAAKIIERINCQDDQQVVHP